jgi:transketolase
LYMNQEAAYKESVIPSATPVFGLTAGLSITLQNLVGYNGRVFGLNHFGYSAPFNVLDEKFGFTAENVYKQVCEYLQLQP